MNGVFEVECAGCNYQFYMYAPDTVDVGDTLRRLCPKIDDIDHGCRPSRTVRVLARIPQIARQEEYDC